ncbi:MAG: Holliday junction resolvase RuvX [Proteobacteria bacterium]|jgi:putative Holliday junction resolvase|nr:Holliday junction resolvase RuvX [Pseudomonadota bacterium]NBP14713.1 Holliday junction resolvase RuvX [bacterium]
MKILALDLGDVWTGTALSDALKMFSRPHQTVKTTALIPFLEATFKEHKISTVVVGYPKTLKGTESDQTRKIVSHKEQLEKQFPLVSWVLWDERMTSKQAQIIHNKKEDKQKVHSIAAALILETYLMYLEIHKDSFEE